MNKDWFEERNREERKQEFKFKVKRKAAEAKAWVVRNKEAVIAFTPVVIGGIATITKVVGKNVNLRKAETIKNRYCYDASLGHYWRLRRSLTNREWLEVETRRANGERLGNILDDMNVLK